jgi:membrane protease YdiL (CAAX protease family)
MMDFLIKYRIPVAIGFFVCQFVWMLGNYSLFELDNLNFAAGLSLLFLVSFWMFLLTDMMRKKIFNKTFWLISMLVMPYLAPAVYLFQRKKLQRL